MSVLRWILGLWLCGTLTQAPAAQRRFDFGDFKVGEPPPGFRSLVTGAGRPGVWTVVMDDVPPTLAPITAGGAAATRRAVIAQTSRDPADERFLVLMHDAERYGDCRVTVRFKTVAGAVEQMAGIAFRIQDERNYYVLRASSLGNTLRFYKFVDGVRSEPIGPDVTIPRGEWHALAVECKGNQIRCFLNGREAMPALNDGSFSQGYVGLWTKSDAVSHFVDFEIEFTPIEPLAQVLVRQLMGKYPRLIGLRIAGRRPGGSEVVVLGSSVAEDLGKPAMKIEREVFETDGIGYLKEKEQVIVTLPLHDANGEPLASMQVVLKPFAGQTRDNAIARATPIVQAAQRGLGGGNKLAE